jgi:hypothetical protein
MGIVLKIASKIKHHMHNPKDHRLFHRAKALKLLYVNRSRAVVIEEAPNGAINLFVSFL